MMPDSETSAVFSRGSTQAPGKRGNRRSGYGDGLGRIGWMGGAHWIILLARGAVDIDSAHVVVGESSGKGNE
jgi:hypothetical protein